MTVGKDVAMLFTDVINCIQTGESGNRAKGTLIHIPPSCLHW